MKTSASATKDYEQAKEKLGTVESELEDALKKIEALQDEKKSFDERLETYVRNLHPVHFHVLAV